MTFHELMKKVTDDPNYPLSPRQEIFYELVARAVEQGKRVRVILPTKKGTRN